STAPHTCAATSPGSARSRTRSGRVTDLDDRPAAVLTGPVHVVGSGLLGTSLGLALRARGLEVYLSDRSPEHLRTASGLGAGTAYDGSPVQLVVVAVPPDHVGATVARELAASAAVVTDVGSIKGQPLEQ